jgi:hypothetical protein
LAAESGQGAERMTGPEMMAPIRRVFEKSPLERPGRAIIC